MKLKENLRMLLERIKLSNSEYLMMQEKANRFNNMLAAIGFETNSRYTDVQDNEGICILKFPESKTLTISINASDLMKTMGIEYDKCCTNIKVIE